MRVFNETRQRLVADRAEEATTFATRLKGLLGRRTLDAGEGLHIDPCNSIHMFFMRFAIDAVLLDRDLQVVKIVHAIPPWRVTSVYRSARSVLELPAGVAQATGMQEGDRLRFDR